MFLCILFSLVVTLLILTCMPCRYKRITKGKSCYNCQILSYTLVNITIFLVCESISHNLVNPSLLRYNKYTRQYNTIQLHKFGLLYNTIQKSINQGTRGCKIISKKSGHNKQTMQSMFIDAAGYYFNKQDNEWCDTTSTVWFLRNEWNVREMNKLGKLKEMKEIELS
jgi:hypothetical protein